ncbi:hypothetical protein [Synechococcus sp. WH 5701]|uniref:hypothetical protein n=1 Tax=Synechococcus sp. WH 5701 TaxID=69042 RepID=UPI0018DBE829|nr:hypothetical protein [Synechococcus sp. WH 5701]
MVVALRHNSEASQIHVLKLAGDAVAEPIEAEIRVEGPAFSICNEGAGTWGHFIGHNLPRAMLFLQHVPHGRIIVPEAYLTKNKTFLELLFRAGIALSQIVPAPHRCILHLDADGATRFVTQVTLCARELGVAIAQTSFDTGESQERAAQKALLSTLELEGVLIQAVGPAFSEGVALHTSPAFFSSPPSRAPTCS